MIMKLYACGCNLSGQISSPTTVDNLWTLIQECKDQMNESNYERKNSIIAFSFSYCVYAYDNTVIIKGFDSPINEQISIPKPLKTSSDNTPLRIINVSTYKNHIIVIQSNGDIWRLDLLDKIKQRRFQGSEIKKHPVMEKTNFISHENVNNQNVTESRESENVTRNEAVHSKPLLEEKIEERNNQASHSKSRETREIETQELEYTNKFINTQSAEEVIVRKDIKCTMTNDRTGSSLEEIVKGEGLVSLTKITHLFACELDVCDSETSFESEEPEEQCLGNSTESERSTNEHESKRQKISPRRRNQLIKAVSSDNMQLLLSEQGQVFHMPGRLDYFLGIVVTDIACGFDHCLALTEDGRVYSWGNGSRGQLGYPSSGDTHSPWEIHALSGLGVCQISGGGWHSVARTREGFLYAWGWNNSGQLGVRGKLDLVVYEPQPMFWKEDADSQDMKVVDIACGSRHTLALCDNNSVWGCGWNEYNQLSLSSEVGRVEELTQLPLPHLPENSTVVNLFSDHWNSALLVS